MAGTPATVVLGKLGIAYTVHEYDHDPRATSFGLEAAQALGLPVLSVFKTLVANVDMVPSVALVPVSCMLDLKALAVARGGRRADLVDPEAAQRLTGYVVGGISPLGQRKSLPTIVDESALLLDVMFVSGGRRGLDVGLAPADLIRATGAVTAAIARAS